MKKLIVVSLISLMGAISSLPAQAAVFALPGGPFTPANTPTTVNFGGSGTNGFVDDFTFVTTVRSYLTDSSITNAFAQAGQQIANFTLTLLSGTPGSGTMVGSPIVATYTPGAHSGFQYGGPLEAVIGPGSYYLEVSGTTGGLQASYGGSFAIASVPEPATWAMMLMGFAGLGFAGLRSRKAKPFAA